MKDEITNHTAVDEAIAMISAISYDVRGGATEIIASSDDPKAVALALALFASYAFEESFGPHMPLYLQQFALQLQPEEVT